MTTQKQTQAIKERQAILRKALAEIRAAREGVGKEIEKMGWKTVKVNRKTKR